MTTTWFNTPERLSMLRTQASLWIGTPWLPNSCTRGRHGGVSCQMLVSEIYRGCGFCDVRVPEVPMSQARFSDRDLFLPWMAARPEFAEVPTAEKMPGDLLGFRLGRIVHHMGVLLGTGGQFEANHSTLMFIHSMDHIGCCYNSLG